MKTRKFLSVIISVAMLVCFSSTAYAINAPEVQIEPQVFNEFSYITELQEKTSEELSILGLSRQDVDDVVSEFENALAVRAALPEAQLIAYGYTEEEIAILRAYENGKTLSDAELQSVTATCTTAIVNHGVTASSAEFAYEWSWDQCPLITLTDAVAISWKAYDAENDDNDVELNWITSKVHYWTGNAYMFTMDGEEEQGIEFSAANIQFPLEYSVGGAISYDCYAKTGEVCVSVVLPSGITREIHHLFVAGLYGHTTIGIGAPSVNVSALDGISISFSGNTAIDSIGGKKATIQNYDVSYWG